MISFRTSASNELAIWKIKIYSDQNPWILRKRSLEIHKKAFSKSIFWYKTVQTKKYTANFKQVMLDLLRRPKAFHFKFAVNSFVSTPSLQLARLRDSRTAQALHAFKNSTRTASLSSSALNTFWITLNYSKIKNGNYKKLTNLQQSIVSHLIRLREPDRIVYLLAEC